LDWSLRADFGAADSEIEAGAAPVSCTSRSEIAKVDLTNCNLPSQILPFSCLFSVTYEHSRSDVPIIPNANILGRGAPERKQLVLLTSSKRRLPNPLRKLETPFKRFLMHENRNWWIVRASSGTMSAANRKPNAQLKCPHLRAGVRTGTREAYEHRQ
jgi:hypothetical protein